MKYRVSDGSSYSEDYPTLADAIQAMQDWHETAKQNDDIDIDWDALPRIQGTTLAEVQTSEDIHMDALAEALGYDSTDMDRISSDLALDITEIP